MRTLICCLISLPLASLHITSSFGYRMHPITGIYAFHNGVDLRARSDTVYALADGEISAVSYDYRSGIHISIAHSGFETLYGHLSQVFVAAADTVTTGQPIGITGKTGRVTGEHLHFSIRAAGRWADPLEFIYQLINKKNMSKNFKPLYAQLADKLTAEFKAGTSPYQKPVKDNGRPAFVTPVNPITGKGYSALNALNLAMRGYDDPRWMSADSASFNGYLVKEGSKGTLINFPKRNEIQAIRTPDGQKVKDDAGVTQTRTVEFDKVQNGKAFLFNAEQIRDMPPLEDWLKTAAEQQPLSPAERAKKMIADTGAVIVHGGQEAYYDQAKDKIHLPEREAFENETRYLQAAIHQLAHWTGHESRLNRPMNGKFGSMDYAREELRAATAAMLIGGDLKIGHNFGQHAAYTGAWSKILKDEPFELSRAAADAQKIVTALMNAGQKREVKEDQAVSNTLSKGEEIAYNDTTYKVVDKKGKSFEIEKEDTGERFKVKPTDQVFKKLIEARNNPQSAEREQEPELTADTEQSHKIGR